MKTDSSCIVQVRNLTKVYRDFWRRPRVRAVDGLDLDVQSGEIFGLLGPNGSGKSTTLKIVLGLLYPSSGDVAVFGRSPRNVIAKHRIGYLPEESYLYTYLTPRETLDFYGRLFGLSRKILKARTEELLQMVDLTHAADRQVGELSKGMARRVGLAQALINNPQLVILDEPTSGLDPIGCRQVKDLILTLAHSGKTVVLSSHLLADVEDVCDRVCILYNGRMCAQGHVRSLLQKKDRLQLNLPALTPEATAKLLAILRKKFHAEADVTHPCVDLEQFFLEVVERAHQSSPTGQTAPRNVHVAEYLKHGS